MKKSILFKIWKFPQLSETFIVNQIILAIKLGYDVKILVGELYDIPENANNNLFEKHELRDKIIVEDHNVPTKKAKRVFRASWLVFSNIILVPHLISYYNSTNRKGLKPLFEFFFYNNFREFDVIHIQFGTNKHPIDILKKIGFIKSKLIVSFHGHDVHFPINNRIHNNGYYNRLFETADFLIANTAFLKDKLVALKAPVEKIKIIPVAVDTTIFKPTFLGDKKYGPTKIISIGRLERIKGHDIGIKCISQLVMKGYDIEYSIIGDGSQKELLVNLIQNYNLEKNVNLLGRKSQEDISVILPTQDVFLMTSITDPDYGVESQGLVTAEAQACGLPVVAFDTGGVKYTLLDGKTGFLCKENDLSCYVDKIEFLLKNDMIRNEMSKEAIRFIEKEYSENSVLNKWRIIYDNQVGGDSK